MSMSELRFHGDGAPGVGMSNAQEAHIAAVRDRVAQAMHAMGGDPVKAAAWLYENTVPGDDVDRHALSELRETLRDLGTEEVFNQYLHGPTTDFDPLWRMVEERHRQPRPFAALIDRMLFASATDTDPIHSLLRTAA